jgi:integral membrane protein (TIGR01906 family)
MKIIKSILLFVVAITIPLLLVTSSIRLTLSPVYINLEYRMPYFPDDPYGFSTEERLYWARYSIDYLIGRISHEELTRQTLPNGNPLFNDRELVHMLDVRHLTGIVLLIWRLAVIFSLLMLALAMRFNYFAEWLHAMRKGSFLTILLVAAILLYVALDFNRLFTQFHMLFFEGDSWLFDPSDHLIRLFPLRFWQDLFIFIGAIILVPAAAVIFSTGKKRKNY